MRSSSHALGRPTLRAVRLEAAALLELVSHLIWRSRSPLCAILVAAIAAADSAAVGVSKHLDDLEKATKSAQMAGDNAWMLTNSALVLMMTSPGLASAVLLWPGAAQERARHDDAQLRPDGIGNDHMGRGRLQSGVFGGVALPRRLATRVSKRCRRRSQPRLRGDHPSAN